MKLKETVFPMLHIVQQNVSGLVIKSSVYMEDRAPLSRGGGY